MRKMFLFAVVFLMFAGVAGAETTEYTLSSREDILCCSDWDLDIPPYGMNETFDLKLNADLSYEYYSLQMFECLSFDSFMEFLFKKYDEEAMAKEKYSLKLIEPNFLKWKKDALFYIGWYRMYACYTGFCGWSCETECPYSTEYLFVAIVHYLTGKPIYVIVNDYLFLKEDSDGEDKLTYEIPIRIEVQDFLYWDKEIKPRDDGYLDFEFKEFLKVFTEE